MACVTWVRQQEQPDSYNTSTSETPVTCSILSMERTTVRIFDGLTVRETCDTCVLHLSRMGGYFDFEYAI